MLGEMKILDLAKGQKEEFLNYAQDDQALLKEQNLKIILIIPISFPFLLKLQDPENKFCLTTLLKMITPLFTAHTVLTSHLALSTDCLVQSALFFTKSEYRYYVLSPKLNNMEEATTESDVITPTACLTKNQSHNKFI